MAQKTIRKNGKPYSGAERFRRFWKEQKKKEKDTRKAARITSRIDNPPPVEIYPIAIAEITEIDLASETVDAIITDPPYAEIDLPLYGELAALALRVLKPSGWCLTMVGDNYLNRVFQLMAPLCWRASVFVTFPGGGHSKMGSTRTFQAAKQILVYQKPPVAPPRLWGPNIIALDWAEQDKSLHPWQQSQTLFEKLVDRFTAVGNLVVDPFAGSGTTLKAALVIGRRAWGCDNGKISKTNGS